MKHFKLILSIFLLFSMVSCNDENQTESKTSSVLETPQVNENVLFYQTEKISDLAKMNSLILDNVTASNKKETITNLFNNCEVAINESNSINEISNLYDKCLNDVYDLLPADEEVSVALEIVDDAEELKVLKLLDEYAFRNHLIGAPLADSDWGYAGINLNTLDSNTWEYFFGENGTICQTTKENYWDVKPYMSNDNFIKGINLALDKSLFLDMIYRGDEESNKVILDVSLCDYYEFDIELARKYFKVALEEMIEQGIYDVNNLSEPINLTIEMAWDPWTSYNKYEEYHNNIKNCIESAFNDETVTNGNFNLIVESFQSSNFAQIYSEKIYVGQFDMCFGTISGSSKLHTYDEFLRLSSTREFSNGFNVNWSIDTSSLVDCIVYNGYKYSYDKMLEQLIEYDKKNSEVIPSTYRKVNVLKTKKALINYQLEYELYTPGNQMSYNFLWEGYDEYNKFGPTLDKKNRFYTYITEYKEENEDFYLVYMNLNDIDKYKRWLENYENIHSTNLNNYHFSKFDNQSIIDGKYLFAYQNDSENELKCYLVRNIKDIQYRVNDYQLIFCAKAKRAIIKSNLSNKKEINKQILLFNKYELFFEKIDLPPSYYTFETFEKNNQSYLNKMFEYVGEMIESFPITYEEMEFGYFPTLGLKQYYNFKSIRVEIVTENNEKYILLPRYINSSNQKVDLLSDETNFVLEEDIFSKYKSEFLEAFYKEVTTENMPYIMGLYKYENVIKIIN